MLRIHLLRHLFNYSDPAMKKALDEVPLYCRFVGLDLAVDTVPDETTLCTFWHLLERHRLADVLVREINAEPIVGIWRQGLHRRASLSGL